MSKKSANLFPMREGYGYLNLKQSEFNAFPPVVQKLLLTFGKEYPQGIGKPSVIEVPLSRIGEIEEIYLDEIEKEEREKSLEEIEKTS